MSNKGLFSDPIALLVVLVVGFVLAVTLILFAAIVVLPFAIIAVAAFFAYRHYKLEKLRSPANVPDTVKERTDYLTPEQFSHGISERTLLNRIEEDTDLYSCQSLSDAFNQLATQLYAQESFHQPPRQPVTNDRITLSRYYDQLEAWQRKVSDISNNDDVLWRARPSLSHAPEILPALRPEPHPQRIAIQTVCPIADRKRGRSDQRPHRRYSSTRSSKSGSCSKNCAARSKRTNPRTRVFRFTSILPTHPSASFAGYRCRSICRTKLASPACGCWRRRGAARPRFCIPWSRKISRRTPRSF